MQEAKPSILPASPTVDSPTPARRDWRLWQRRLHGVVGLLALMLVLSGCQTASSPGSQTQPLTFNQWSLAQGTEHTVRGQGWRLDQELARTAKALGWGVMRQETQPARLTSTTPADQPVTARLMARLPDGREAQALATAPADKSGTLTLRIQVGHFGDALAQQRFARHLQVQLDGPPPPQRLRFVLPE